MTNVEKHLEPVDPWVCNSMHKYLDEMEKDVRMIEEVLKSADRSSIGVDALKSEIHNAKSYLHDVCKQTKAWWAITVGTHDDVVEAHSKPSYADWAQGPFKTKEQAMAYLKHPTAVPKLAWEKK